VPSRHLQRWRRVVVQQLQRRLRVPRRLQLVDARGRDLPCRSLQRGRRDGVHQLHVRGGLRLRRRRRVSRWLSVPGGSVRHWRCGGVRQLQRRLRVPCRLDVRDACIGQMYRWSLQRVGRAVVHQLHRSAWLRLRQRRRVARRNAMCCGSVRHWRCRGVCCLQRRLRVCGRLQLVDARRVDVPRRSLQRVRRVVVFTVHRQPRLRLPCWRDLCCRSPLSRGSVRCRRQQSVPQLLRRLHLRRWVLSLESETVSSGHVQSVGRHDVQQLQRRLRVSQCVGVGDTCHCHLPCRSLQRVGRDDVHQLHRRLRVSSGLELIST
jgi:hypothetical protein